MLGPYGHQRDGHMGQSLRMFISRKWSKFLGTEGIDNTKAMKKVFEKFDT